MNNRRILYRLKTLDGFKSEIREADNFMPVISITRNTAIINQTYEGTTNCDEPFPEVKSKSFRMKKHETVEFIEYEEF